MKKQIERLAGHQDDCDFDGSAELAEVPSSVERL